MLQRQISDWYFPSLQSGLLRNITLTAVSALYLCVYSTHLAQKRYTSEARQTLLLWMEGLASQTTYVNNV